MDELLFILGGVVFALGFIACARSLGPQREIGLYGIALIPTAAVYVVFALIEGMWSSLPVELLGVVPFGGLGLAGVWRVPVLIVIGWAGHGGWDLVMAQKSAYVPPWYPILCVGTDIFLAGYISALIWPRTA